MIVTLDMPGPKLACRVPETTGDVLEWLVRIRCMESPEHRFTAAKLWLFSHVLELPDGYELPTTDGEERPGITWLERACSTLAQLAELPPRVVDDIERMECRKLDIDDTWKPLSRCDCVQCRWDPDDGPPPELPPGQTCIYGDIDRRAVMVSTLIAGIEDLSAPWWFTQARLAMKRAEWKANRKRAEDSDPEERKDYVESGQELGQLLRGGRR